MRVTSLTFLSVLATTVLGQGQNIPGIPECAGSCISGFGGCGRFDVECICSNDDLISGLACCVSKQCDEDDQEKTIDFANGLCQGYGVELPQSATCAAGSSATASSSSSGASQTTGGGASPTTGGSMSSSMSATPTSGSSSDDSDDSDSASDSDESMSASPAPTGGAVRDRVGAAGMGVVLAGIVAAL